MSDVNLLWDAVTVDTDGNPISVAQYVIYETTTATPVLLSGSTAATNQTLTGVTPGVHKYRVAARRIIGDATTEGPMSNEITVNTNPIPVAPANLTGTIS